MIRNVIFDWSGTLVDDLPAVLQASNHVFRLAGVPEMSLAQFRAEFCLPFKRFYDRYVPHVPLPQLETWFHAEFRRAQHLVTPLPHAREFLEFCRARALRTFLLSSVHAEHYAPQAAGTGFGEFIERPYTQVWDKTRKIHDLLVEHRLEPRETLFIGDMEHDIETARHGGVWSCAVLTGYNNLAQLRASGPDLIVEHLGELRALLAAADLEFAGARHGNQRAGAPRPVATVGALIFNEAGEVLLVRTRKWSNRWGIPGGKIEFGETSTDALRRELNEETGLAVIDLEFVMVQDCIHSEEFYRDAHFLLLNYTCRSVGTDAVRLNDEAQAFRWVPPAQALELDLNQPTRRLVETVLARARSAMADMDTITIADLEVHFCVGVPDEERAQPQRLLLTVQIGHDFEVAAIHDDLRRTIDYFEVVQRLLKFGENRSWRLIETLAVEVADSLLREYHPRSVGVEVKKFIIPEARYVSASVTRVATGR